MNMQMAEGETAEPGCKAFYKVGGAAVLITVLVVLAEIAMDENKFTGRRLPVRVSYILRSSQFGLATGYCIMGVEFLGEA